MSFHQDFSREAARHRISGWRAEADAGRLAAATKEASLKPGMRARVLSAMQAMASMALDRWVTRESRPASAATEKRRLSPIAGPFRTARGSYAAVTKTREAITAGSRQAAPHRLSGENGNVVVADPSRGGLHADLRAFE
jgi:hypothetical protein